MQTTLILFALILLGSMCFSEDELTQKAVFTSGEGGYHTYRIPALVVTKKGTLLAFCEGRKNSRSDTGEINTLLRRSFDNGKTWGTVQMVAADGSNTFGNPCPVIDRSSGTIWMLLTKNLGEDNEAEIKLGTGKGTRTVWVAKSTDDGATWSAPVEITSAVKKPEWSWYATGPGVGIQMKNGRLVIPCDYSMLGARREYGSHVICSDDGGTSWKLGGNVCPDVNECQVVELEDESLMLNMRSYQGENKRVVATSKDGGLTWSKPRIDPTLIEPVCQASFLRYTNTEPHGRSRLLFSNPASTARERMTVRLSYDEGKTWPVAKLLYPGPSAYSCLAVLDDMTIACLYERGKEHPYETITFARFSLGWLTDGSDKPAKTE
jgi:sialidase-1